MNFFTATEAFSLYPYASFIRNINLLCKATDRSTKQAVLKYIDRGYNLKALVTTKPQKSFCAWTTRRPGDRHTWRIRDHVDVGQTHTPVEGNTWKLRSVQGTIHAQPIYDIFRHRRLKVPIVTSDYMSVQHWFELRTARKRPIGRRSKAEEYVLAFFLCRIRTDDLGPWMTFTPPTATILDSVILYKALFLRVFSEVFTYIVLQQSI